MISDKRNHASFDHHPGNDDRDPASFRVIIVGGGPAGLATAHALTLAGIDWVLLERRSQIVTSVGASIILWPHAVRILDQLGLLDDVRRASLWMRTKHNVMADGHERGGAMDVVELLRTNHGHSWITMSRSKLIEVLYKNLRGEEGRVFVDSAVTDIESHDTGVRVTCANGSVMHGSIVVGCDGAHSVVRGLMGRLRGREQTPGPWSLFRHWIGLHRESQASPSKQQPPSPMKASFHGLIGWAPRPDGVRPSAVSEVRAGPGRSFHILSGPDVTYFLVYVQRDPTSPRHGAAGKQEREHERSRYGEADADALAASLAELPVGGGATFGDLWRSRHWGGMTDFEEGMAERWHHGRVVLLGDAAHKFMPNAGLALNTAWQDMAVLVNGLRAMLLKARSLHQQSQGPLQPNLRRVERVLRAYEGSRKRTAREILRFSGLHARVVTGAGPVYRVLDRVLPVLLGGDAFAFGMVGRRFVRKGVVLDFAAEGSFREGKIKWLHAPRVVVGDCLGKQESDGEETDEEVEHDVHV